MLTIILFIFGVMSGSFVAASVWRLRAEQLLVETDTADPDYQKIVAKNHLAQKSAADDYSRCLNCGYRLKWFDLIPVVSWLVLGGKCRKCRKPIGLMEIFTEIFLGLIFVASYLFWPASIGLVGVGQIGMFAIWLMMMILLVILFIYDLKWLELPTAILYTIIVLSVIFLAVKTIISGIDQVDWLSVAGSILILSGIYWFLSLVTQEKAVGSGDAFIGFALAVLLADWRLAILTLFLANLIGSAVAIPGLLLRKTNFASRLPLGPLLIVAFLVVFWWGELILKLLFGNILMI